MILEGNERGSGAELARHLLNPRDNDHVTIHAMHGFVADDLFGAFSEAEAISGGTQCQKYLFSLSLNPPPDQNVTVEAFEEAIAAVERKLGLVDQPRAIVLHEKLGRRHAHCVWSRIDAGHMKAIKLSHYKRKLMDVSRELYRAHDWDMPEGFKDRDARDLSNFSRQEAGQAKRAKLDPKKQKAMFQQCWNRSDSRSAFAAALWSEGYILARGDRRGFVGIDANGKTWSLSRWCNVKPKELRARLGSEDSLWSVEEAKQAFNEIRSRGQAASASKSDPNPDLEPRLAALVQKQRQERETLQAKQEAQRLADLKTHQSSLPTGLKLVWARLMGQFRAQVKRYDEEVAANALSNRQEQQALIDRHMAERRTLEREFAQPDILAELTRSFDAAINPDPRQRLVLPADDIPFTAKKLKKNPSLILNHISHKKARFSRTDVLRELGKRIDDPMALRAAADTALNSPDLVRLNDGHAQNFTTKDFLAADAHLEQCSNQMSKKNGFSVNSSHINSAIHDQDRDMRNRFGGRLSDEQHNALHHILGDNQFACVVGLAGSGKSTMLKTAHAAWKMKGLIVHGAALAGKAADGLQSASGIPSRTLASLEASWENGNEPISPGDVVVVDEAGMVGTRQLMRFANKLSDVGAKMVLIGDPDQLQPIEAGTPFRKLIESQGAVRLTEIHRQREEWQRVASRSLANGKIREAVEAYAHHEAVSQRGSRDTALAALVEDYLADVEQHGSDVSRLAFAHRRKDVHAINQAIRTGLRLSEPLAPETLFDTETGPRALAKGDRIVFTRNDNVLGVKNGVLGTVTKATSAGISVVLDNQANNTREFTFNPNHYRDFDHGYAVTIHKSQGATVDRSYVLASRSMDDHLSYVAITRHRYGMKLYVNAKDRPTWSIDLAASRMRGPRRKSSGPKR